MGPLRSSSQAATYNYLSNHSKVEVILLSALPKGTTSELLTLFGAVLLIYLSSFLSQETAK